MHKLYLESVDMHYIYSVADEKLSAVIHMYGEHIPEQVSQSILFVQFQLQLYKINDRIRHKRTTLALALEESEIR